MIYPVFYKFSSGISSIINAGMVILGWTVITGRSPFISDDSGWWGGSATKHFRQDSRMYV